MIVMTGKQLLQIVGLWQEPQEASTFEELCRELHDVPQRFWDLADHLEKDGHHEHVGFMRASAERYAKILGVKLWHERETTV